MEKSVLMNDERESLDLFWMQRALELAQKAQSLGEVPIGAVLVKDDQIIGKVITHRSANTIRRRMRRSWLCAKRRDVWAIIGC